ncbi:11703_t:CDS:1, partial [Cetraspora pellucida]
IIHERKYRTTNPLFTLFQQKRAVDIVRSLIDIYQNEGYMPDGR